MSYSDLKKIFKAEPKSVFDLLCEWKSVGFYMPAYQRPYSWEEKNIRDFFEDCENVFKNLIESEDAIIFMGSILTVDDSDAKSIIPLKKRHTPNQIKLVIDGQQRLSTLVLIIVALNERLRIYRSDVEELIEKKKKASELQSEDNEVLGDLDNLHEDVYSLIYDTNCFSVETQAKDQLYKFLPRIIRSHVDCWGKDNDSAKYESPLTRFLMEYQRHVSDLESSNDMKFKEVDVGALPEESRRVVSNFKEIRKQLNRVQSGFLLKKTGLSPKDSEESSDSDFLSLEGIFFKGGRGVDSERECNDNFKNCLDFPVSEALLDEALSNEKLSKAIYLSAFSRFLLHRVCITYVEVNSESYAFDMFEALNTTGEPLTAIETFVPKVVEYIGVLRNEGDNESEDVIKKAQSDLDSVVKRFSHIIKPKEKSDKTKSLILAFVRAYEGKVKVTSLRDQRDAMTESYKNCIFAYKNDYMHYFKKSSDFLFDHWWRVSVNGLVHESEEDVATVCLSYLVDIKHEIVQSLLIQAFLQDDKYGEVGSKNSNFFQVLKAITAFSVLWRAMSGGADGIDIVYKKIHEKGLEVSENKGNPYQLREPPRLNSLSQEGEVKLANVCGSNGFFNIEDLKSHFKKSLEDKILKKGSVKEDTADQWLDICSKQPLLSKPKNIKFLVLASYHGMRFENGSFHESSAIDFLNPMMWKLISEGGCIKPVFSKDHVRDLSLWADDRVREPENFNKLGNVFVSTGDDDISDDEMRSWPFLKSRMLSLYEESIKDFNNMSKPGLELSNQGDQELLKSMIHIKYAEIAYADVWGEKEIGERTDALLGNALRNLNQWLD